MEINDIWDDDEDRATVLGERSKGGHEVIGIEPMPKKRNIPKRIYIPKDASNSGIDVTFTKLAQRIDIGGWYDSCVGLSGESFTLREFFDQLGITEADCRKAWRKPVGQADQAASDDEDETYDCPIHGNLGEIDCPRC